MAYSVTATLCFWRIVDRTSGLQLICRPPTADGIAIGHDYAELRSPGARQGIEPVHANRIPAVAQILVVVMSGAFRAPAPASEGDQMRTPKPAQVVTCRV
jgi:hypothetical protein